MDFSPTPSPTPVINGCHGIRWTQDPTATAFAEPYRGGFIGVVILDKPAGISWEDYRRGIKDALADWREICGIQIGLADHGSIGIGVQPHLGSAGGTYNSVPTHGKARIVFDTGGNRKWKTEGIRKILRHELWHATTGQDHIGGSHCSFHYSASAKWFCPEEVRLVQGYFGKPADRVEHPEVAAYDVVIRRLIRKRNNLRKRMREDFIPAYRDAVEDYRNTLIELRSLYGDKDPQVRQRRKELIKTLESLEKKRDRHSTRITSTKEELETLAGQAREAGRQKQNLLRKYN